MECLGHLVPGGLAKLEENRRRAWRQVLREIRTTIRRLHHMTGHTSKLVMKQLALGSKQDRHLISAIDHFKCEQCPHDAHPRVSPVKMPIPMHVQLHRDRGRLGVNDIDGERYSFLSIV